MPEDTVSWSRITGWRAECFRRYGSIHQTPVVDISAELKRLVGQATSVLDFGAGVELPLRAIVDETKTRYRSLDSDPEGTFDFSDISDVPHDEHFDLVVANQVMEHIPLADDLAIVRAIADRLSPGGRLAITVPSASHPVRHWADVTHVTHWPADDLYGLIREGGLEVETLARYGKRKLSRRPLRRLIVRAVAAEFRIDWMDSLLIVGRRPS